MVVAPSDPDIVFSGEVHRRHRVIVILNNEAAGTDILVPDFILHGVGFIGDLLSDVGFRKVLSRENAWTTTMYHWFSNEKAKNELRLSFKSADYSLKQSVDWMKSKSGYEKKF